MKDVCSLNYISQKYLVHGVFLGWFKYRAKHLIDQMLKKVAAKLQ